MITKAKKHETELSRTEFNNLNQMALIFFNGNFRKKPPRAVMEAFAKKADFSKAKALNFFMNYK